MNRSEIEYAYAVMQESDKGNPIGFRPRGGHEAKWFPTKNPTWDWDKFEYRVAKIELVPGKKYQSNKWGVAGEFICMHEDRYLFMSNKLPGSYDYWYAKELPTDIALYKIDE